MVSMWNSRISTFIMSLCIVSSVMGTEVLSKEDLKDIETNPLMLLTTATLDTPFGERLRKDSTSSSPVFVLYEGIQPMYNVGPLTPMKKRFEINTQTGNLEKVFAAPLLKADSSIKSSTIDKMYLIQENNIASNPNWVLNRIVPECTTSSLTFLETQKLLSSKYGWRLSEEVQLPYLCNCGDVKVVSESVEQITVRELVRLMLKVTASHVYANSSSKRWVLIYKVEPAGMDNFAITQTASRD